MYVILYVDDILIAAENEKQIENFITALKKRYEVNHLGEAKFYLGIEIQQLHNGEFMLSQESKINDLVKKFNLTEAKPTYTPLEVNYYGQTGEENILPNNEKYRQAIGTLLYIAGVSRPDIAAPVHILSRRCENPRQKDWNSVKKVIRYLNSTKKLKLKISSEQKPVLSIYCDADYGSDKSDRKSTSGILITLGTNAIQWKSKKQTCVALSSAEAEYIALTEGCRELKHMLTLLEDLDLKQSLPVPIYEDNQSTIKLAQSEKLSSKVKHIDIKRHYIHDLVNKSEIKLVYCPTEMMAADLLTKPMPKVRLEKLRLKFGVVTLA